MKNTNEQNRKQKEFLDDLELKIAFKRASNKDNESYRVGYSAGYSAGHALTLKTQNNFRYEDI